MWYLWFFIEFLSLAIFVDVILHFLAYKLRHGYPNTKPRATPLELTRAVRKIANTHTLEKIPYDETCTYCTHEKTSSWSQLFSSCLCISLSERHDRRKQCNAEFHRVGLCQDVQYLLVERCSIPAMGAWNSHRLACSLIDTTYKPGLVLEDDVIFTPFMDEQLIHDLRTRHLLSGDWAMIRLGQFACISCPLIPLNDSVTMTRSLGYLMHAYLFSTRYKNWIASIDFVALQEEKSLLRQWYSIGSTYYTVDARSAMEFPQDCYSLYPSTIIQRDDTESNIRNGELYALFCGRWNTLADLETYVTSLPPLLSEMLLDWVEFIPTLMIPMVTIFTGVFCAIRAGHLKDLLRILFHRIF